MELLKTFTNKNGESVEVYATKTEHEKNSGLMELWLKHGYLKNYIPTTWSIQTYCNTKDNGCRAYYNPTIKVSKDNKRMIINFDMMLEATENNLQRIFDNIQKMIDADIKMLHE